MAEMEDELRSMANRKAIGTDGLLAKLLKLNLDGDVNILEKNYDVVAAVWKGGIVPLKWKRCFTKRPYSTELVSYRGISLGTNAGKLPCRLSPAI